MISNNKFMKIRVYSFPTSSLKLPVSGSILAVSPCSPLSQLHSLLHSMCKIPGPRDTSVMMSNFKSLSVPFLNSTCSSWGVLSTRTYWTIWIDVAINLLKAIDRAIFKLVRQFVSWLVDLCHVGGEGHVQFRHLYDTPINSYAHKRYDLNCQNILNGARIS